MAKKNKKEYKTAKSKTKPLKVSVEELFRKGSEAQTIYDYPTAIELYKQALTIDEITSEKLTLKVASVIGQTYSLQALQEVYPLEADKPFLGKHMDTLAKLDLILPLSKDSGFTFRDEVTHESVYNSMLFSQRRQLHRQIAEWIEANNPEDLSPHFATLANHWRNADDTGKAIDYLEKAGQKALQRGDYEQAERFFRECLELDASAAVLSTEFFAKKLNREQASA